ncbi:hypothetical protein ACWC9X_18125 [Streptomyces asoensis]|uniref:hypothetical protein n=1 Tax=Streptomyces sp. MBT49 TaxID=1488380 RepID=UPI00190BBE7A|nr:hypothetical protein [Streptomyces sp. MBT49]MBK3625969.1 hypothetical protein [Streptomyces sp. MBT49]
MQLDLRKSRGRSPVNDAVQDDSDAAIGHTKIITSCKPYGDVWYGHWLVREQPALR